MEGGSWLMASPFTAQDEDAASQATASARVMGPPVTTAVADTHPTDSKTSVKHGYRTLQELFGRHDGLFGTGDSRSKITMGRLTWARSEGLESQPSDASMTLLCRVK